jgi:hypothetical protein
VLQALASPRFISDRVEYFVEGPFIGGDEVDRSAARATPLGTRKRRTEVSLIYPACIKHTGRPRTRADSCAMKSLLVTWLIVAVAMVATGWVVPGFKVKEGRNPPPGGGCLTHRVLRARPRQLS